MNNPAARLLDILKSAKESAEEIQSQNVSTVRMSMVWCEVFEVDYNQYYRVYYHFALVEKLIEEIELGIKALPQLSYSLYTSQLHKVRELLQPSAINALRAKVLMLLPI